MVKTNTDIKKYMTDEVQKSHQKEYCQKPENKNNVVYNEITFSRELIDKTKAILVPYYKMELSDEESARDLYTYAKLKILLRAIKERNEARKSANAEAVQEADQ